MVPAQLTLLFFIRRLCTRVNTLASLIDNCQRTSTRASFETVDRRCWSLTMHEKKDNRKDKVKGSPEKYSHQRNETNVASNQVSSIVIAGIETIKWLNKIANKNDHSPFLDTSSSTRFSKFWISGGKRWISLSLKPSFLSLCSRKKFWKEGKRRLAKKKEESIDNKSHPITYTSYLHSSSLHYSWLNDTSWTQ